MAYTNRVQTAWSRMEPADRKTLLRAFAKRFPSFIGECEGSSPDALAEREYSVLPPGVRNVVALSIVADGRFVVEEYERIAKLFAVVS